MRISDWSSDVCSSDLPYNILITGIGGTGVVTIGQILGMAAHLEGYGTSVLDFTGLAQKNGAVLSHVRIAKTPEDIHAVRVAAGGASLLLGCDMVVASGDAALERSEEHTSELQSLMRRSYAVFCLKKKKK